MKSLKDECEFNSQESCESSSFDSLPDTESEENSISDGGYESASAHRPTTPQEEISLNNLELSDNMPSIPLRNEVWRHEAKTAKVRLREIYVSIDKPDTDGNEEQGKNKRDQKTYEKEMKMHNELFCMIDNFKINYKTLPSTY